MLHELLKTAELQISLTVYGEALIYRPYNSNIRVIKPYPGIRLRIIFPVTLVQHDRPILKTGKTVCKSAGDIEAQMVFRAQLLRSPFFKSWTVGS